MKTSFCARIYGTEELIKKLENEETDSNETLIEFPAFMRGEFVKKAMELFAKNL